MTGDLERLSSRSSEWKEAAVTDEILPDENIDDVVRGTRNRHLVGGADGLGSHFVGGETATHRDRHGGLKRASIDGVVELNCHRGRLDRF